VCESRIPESADARPMDDGLRRVAVRLYVRPRVAGRHSIERVTRTIHRHLPDDIDGVCITLTRPSRGIIGRLAALAEVLSRAPGVHHVTGDVQFLVLGLPWSRTVLTIHDLVHLNHLKGLRRAIYRLFWFQIPTRLAAAVTVISEQTRLELCREFPNLVAKVEVIPNPLVEGFFPREPLVKSHSRPIILHVGTSRNKNLQLSIAVAVALDADLIVLGMLSPKQADVLLNSGVRFEDLHNVSDELVGDLYRRADLLLFASLAEGFGLPILEAQACGLPVITSDREPMRTVAGGAARLIDPQDREGAIQAARDILESEELRADMRLRGLQNVERYQPRQVSAMYANIYRQLNRNEE
jgi:glycosyltransferase involved in cell wall biosynthesis